MLPVRVPNLLINGAEGIAVGMSTSIPPHNLGEVADAVKAYIDNRLMTVEDLMEYPSRPDSPPAASSPTKRISFPFMRQARERSASAERWRWSWAAGRRTGISW